ncbi:MAG: alpha/beta fold hydrolase [Dehalococcoidia bacterium]
MMATRATFPSMAAVAWRPVGKGHAVFALGVGLTWLHVLDASLVHRQAHAGVLEELALALMAIVLPPLAVLAYPRASMVIRAAVASTVGFVALSGGLAMHVAGIVMNERWVRSDATGVLMAVGGGVLVVLGVVLATAAIPRRRYRLLMVPGVLVSLAFVLVPLGLAVAITHVPRRAVVEQDLGAAYQSVAFETSDGLTLRGWYVPSRNGAAVVIAHGSGSNRLGGVRHARVLVEHGFGVLLYDARGHGESDGATNMLGWGADLDIVAAARFAEAQPDVEAGRVGILGLSMGAELAIEAAAHSDVLAAVVADGASGRTLGDARDASPPRSVVLTQLPALFVADTAVSLLSGRAAPANLTSLSPLVQEPVLYVAAGQDPIERALVSRIASESGGEHELWVVDAGHTRGLATFPAEYEARVIGFFERWLASAGANAR